MFLKQNNKCMGKLSVNLNVEKKKPAFEIKQLSFITI